MKGSTKCACGRSKRKIVSECYKCTLYRLTGSKDPNYCMCGNIITDDQKAEYGVCEECR
jgi:hypothetical protein